MKRQCHFSVLHFTYLRGGGCVRTQRIPAAYGPDYSARILKNIL